MSDMTDKIDPHMINTHNCHHGYIPTHLHARETIHRIFGPLFLVHVIGCVVYVAQSGYNGPFLALAYPLKIYATQTVHTNIQRHWHEPWHIHIVYSLYYLTDYSDFHLCASLYSPILTSAPCSPLTKLRQSIGFLPAGCNFRTSKLSPFNFVCNNFTSMPFIFVRPHPNARI